MDAWGVGLHCMLDELGREAALQFCSIRQCCMLPGTSSTTSFAELSTPAHIHCLTCSPASLT